MGRGGAPAPWPPLIQKGIEDRENNGGSGPHPERKAPDGACAPRAVCFARRLRDLRKLRSRQARRPFRPPGAPCVGGDGRAAAGFRAISRARLWRRRLYTCPLSTSSSTTALKRMSHLEAGFALRCVQRLSDPGMATLRCAWRHNRQARGQSGTVLSY